MSTGDQRAVTRAVIAALLLLVAGVTFAMLHVRYAWPVGRPFIGIAISDAGLAVQLGALVLGVLAINLTSLAVARRVIVVEGLVCLFAFGWIGVAIAAGLLAVCAAIALRRLGLAVILVAGACATALSTDLAPAGLLAAMLFVPRLLVLLYDCWQRRDEPTALGDLLVYLLPAPLVVLPPYVTFLPLFGGFTAKLSPGLTRDRARRIAKHLVLAAGFGALRLGFAQLDAPELPGKLVVVLLEFAAFAHLVLPLLLLHGIDLAPPLDKPLLATRYVELWQRFASHQKDAQVFLFYTPALLRLRRLNRYTAIVLATLWTLVVGNTLIHLAARYVFLPDAGPAIARMIAANGIMGAVLAIDLCVDEYRRRTGAPPRSAARLALGWAVTMTIAASVALL